MIYKALIRFADLKDGNRIYEAGDTYPRPGLYVPPERMAEIAGSDNRMGRPLIQAVPDAAPNKPVNAPDKRRVRKKG